MVSVFLGFIFFGFLQACAVFVIRFDEKNRPYFLKNIRNGLGSFQASSCTSSDVSKAFEVSKVELSTNVSMYSKKGMDNVVVVENNPPVAQTGVNHLSWVRLPVGKDCGKPQFDEGAATVSMILEFDRLSLEAAIGQMTNISPIDKNPLFYSVEPVPQITGMVNVDQVTCYITSALHCLYQVPIFRERLRRIALLMPSNTVNIVVLVNQVFVNMSMGITPDEKLMRTVANTLANEHPIMRNVERKLTIADVYDAIKFILKSLHKCMARTTMVDSLFADLFNLRTNEVYSDFPGFGLYNLSDYLNSERISLNELVLNQIDNVEHLPPYLFISMPRFFGRRIDNQLEFPVESWSIVGPHLDPFVNYTYDLAAVVIHVRSKVEGNNGGHYTVVVKQGDSWIYLDDDKQPIKINLTAEMDLLRTEGTMFMYKRQGIEYVEAEASKEVAKFPEGSIVLNVPHEDEFPVDLLMPGDEGYVPNRNGYPVDDFPYEFLDQDYEEPKEETKPTKKFPLGSMVQPVVHEDDFPYHLLGPEDYGYQHSKANKIDDYEFPPELLETNVEEKQAEEQWPALVPVIMSEPRHLPTRAINQQQSEKKRFGASVLNSTPEPKKQWPVEQKTLTTSPVIQVSNSTVSPKRELKKNQSSKQTFGPRNPSIIGPIVKISSESPNTQSKVQSKPAQILPMTQVVQPTVSSKESMKRDSMTPVSNSADSRSQPKNAHFVQQKPLTTRSTINQTKRQLPVDKQPLKQESGTPVVIPSVNIPSRNIQPVEQKPVGKETMTTVVGPNANVTSGSKRNRRRNIARKEESEKEMPIDEESMNKQKLVDQKEFEKKVSPMVSVIDTESAVPQETKTKISDEDEKRRPITPVINFVPEEPELRHRPVQRHDLVAVEEQSQSPADLRKQVEAVVQTIIDNGPSVAVALLLTALAGYLYRTQ